MPGYEGDRLPKDDPQRTAKLLFLEAIAAGTVGEPDDIDLCCGKEAMRRLVEEQQPDVLREARLRRPADDIHAPAQCLRRNPGFCREVTAHVAKKLLNQPRR